MSEWAQAVVDCLIDAGWSASIPPGTPPGGLDSGPVDDAQFEEYQQDSSECHATVGEYVEIQSEADLRRRYDHLLTQHACLVDAGYHVSGPPTFQTFMDAFNATGDARSYYPLAELGGDESIGAEAACPLDLFE
jgi:hypothetical protein